jgi:hypothetical protein
MNPFTPRYDYSSILYVNGKKENSVIPLQFGDNLMKICKAATCFAVGVWGRKQAETGENRWKQVKTSWKQAETRENKWKQVDNFFSFRIRLDEETVGKICLIDSTSMGVM